jgi:hypothetical protein
LFKRLVFMLSGPFRCRFLLVLARFYGLSPLKSGKMPQSNNLLNLGARRENLLEKSDKNDAGQVGADMKQQT